MKKIVKIMLLLLVFTVFNSGCSKEDEPEVVETCSDGIMNQDETGVDCGGSCGLCVVNAPCTLSNEYLDTGSGNGDTLYGPHNVYYSSSFNEYSFSVSTQFAQVDMRMNFPLAHGEYLTMSGGQPEPGKMIVELRQNSSFYVMAAGSTIYVKQISSGVFDVTICDAPYLLTASIWMDLNIRLTAVNP